jgi:hypothetical protein
MNNTITHIIIDMIVNINIVYIPKIINLKIHEKS